MRRSTWRGSEVQAQGRRKYWAGVALNLTCALVFSALLIGCIFLALDHLTS